MLDWGGEGSGRGAWRERASSCGEAGRLVTSKYVGPETAGGVPGDLKVAMLRRGTSGGCDEGEEFDDEVADRWSEPWSIWPRKVPASCILSLKSRCHDGDRRIRLAQVVPGGYPLNPIPLPPRHLQRLPGRLWNRPYAHCAPPPPSPFIQGSEETF